jgi:hypothetical protein
MFYAPCEYIKMYASSLFHAFSCISAILFHWCNLYYPVVYNECYCLGKHEVQMVLFNF